MKIISNMEIKDLKIVDKRKLSEIEADLGRVLREVEYRIGNPYKQERHLSDSQILELLLNVAEKLGNL